MRLWDIKPFVSGSRNIKTFVGAQVGHGVQPLLWRPSIGAQTGCSVNCHVLQHGSDKNLLRCSWSPDGEMVTAGSADRAVHIWDVPSTQELYYLPGHKGTVNEVRMKGC